MAADNVRQSQQALEHVDLPQADIRESQAALETVAFPPNQIHATQVCLEVLFPAYTPPTPASRRNHSFIGVWMGTGHGDNVSFNF